MTQKLTFHFVTLFPETIRSWLSCSILGRAYNAGLFEYHLYQLRDFSDDKYRTVDDVAYGGGGGMVLKVEPLVRAVEFVRDHLTATTSRTIYFSPAGRRLNQQLVQEYCSPLRQQTNLILICGHYEGVDQRFIDHWVDEEISLGDFVLSGGEIPALAFADALIRQTDGVLGAPQRKEAESFLLRNELGTLLEYPHYTRPQEFRGITVPPPLLSGDHGAVHEWRMAEAHRRTVQRRPDLLNGEASPFDKVDS